MKISCIQLDMKFCDVQSNFALAEKLIHQTVKKENSDVVVLPETWSTGYYPKDNLMSFCEADGARSKKTFSLLAKKLNVNIVAGSVPTLKNGKVYNTAYVFNREGEAVGEYDKTHLFTPMDEHKLFECGKSTEVFSLDGHKCGIIICYDLRFPELVRTLALEGIEILFAVSQWPEKRIEHLKVLSQARAIENQMFVAVCNSCGEADGTRFGGNSRLIDPWGNVLASADEKEEIITADCDLEIIKEIRASINVFNDRKPELYKI
ncbi:MAG: carbon-nitrogen family hydrolase [Clostridia bacterium]|nr:carbon-nitrogen family hydrolase [Clostridia bacterium]